MSVFNKPFENLAKSVKIKTKWKDDALFWHFMARVFESWTSRLTPIGDGDPRMFRRMPEYYFVEGWFGVFKRDPGPFHAWECGGAGGIDEYGFPLSYILNSANGKVIEGQPTPPPTERVVLPPDEVVIFRANHIGLAPIQIITPIIERLVRSIRTIDNITRKRGTSFFYTPDARAKAALDEVLNKLTDDSCDLALAFQSPDLDGLIKELSLFTDAGPALSDLWESARQFASEMWETAGENSVEFEKKERLVTGEVEANDERRENSIFGVCRQNMVEQLAVCREKWGVDWRLPEPEPKPDEPDEPDDPVDPADPGEPDEKDGDDE